MKRLGETELGELEKMLALSGQTLWRVAIDGTIVDAFGALRSSLGYTSEELRGRSLNDLVEPDDLPEATRMFEMASRGDGSDDDFEVEIRVVGKDGESHEVKVNGSKVTKGRDGRPVVLGLSSDITRQKLAERALERERELFVEAFENAPNGMILLHLDAERGGLIKGANSVAAEMTGYSREEVVGMWLTEGGIVKIEEDKLAVALDDSSALLTGEKSMFSIEREIFRSDGTTLRIKADVSALDVGVRGRHDDPFPINAIAHIADVTEQRQTEVEMRYLARHDPLTDVFNRRWFLSLLSDRLDRSVRGHGGGALLMFDLDNFKAVNDSHGHHAGDDALRKVAGLLSSELRESDQVARIGGDEFAALLPSTKSIDGARRVAGNLLEEMSNTTVEISGSGGEVFRPALSIGVLMLDGRDIDAGQALRECDEAMYEAKRQGGGQFVVVGG